MKIYDEKIYDVLKKKIWWDPKIYDLGPKNFACGAENNIYDEKQYIVQSTAEYVYLLKFQLLLLVL